MFDLVLAWRRLSGRLLDDVRTHELGFVAVPLSHELWVVFVFRSSRWGSWVGTLLHGQRALVQAKFGHFL